MLQGFANDIKNNSPILILLGIFLILAGGLAWTLWVTNVNYRFVPDLNNFIKLAGYALIVPILILSSLYPFLKRFPQKAKTEKESINFMKRPLSFAQLTVGALFLATLFIGMGIASAINSFFDASPVKVTKAKVMTKQIWNTRHGKQYVLSVISWPCPEDKRTNITLSRIEYEHLMYHQAILLALVLAKVLWGLIGLLLSQRTPRRTNDRIEI
jgi:hypothetical protein